MYKWWCCSVDRTVDLSFEIEIPSENSEIGKMRTFRLDFLMAFIIPLRCLLSHWVGWMIVWFHLSISNLTISNDFRAARHRSANAQVRRRFFFCFFWRFNTIAHNIHVEYWMLVRLIRINSKSIAKTIIVALSTVALEFSATNKVRWMGTIAAWIKSNSIFGTNSSIG